MSIKTKKHFPLPMKPWQKVTTAVTGLAALVATSWMLLRNPKEPTYENSPKHAPSSPIADPDKPAEPITTLPYTPKPSDVPVKTPLPNDPRIPDWIIRVEYQKNPLKGVNLLAKNLLGGRIFTTQIWDATKEAYCLIDVPHGQYSLWAIYSGKMQDQTFLYTSQRSNFEAENLETLVSLQDPKKIDIRVEDENKRLIPATIKALNLQTNIYAKEERTLTLRTDAIQPISASFTDGFYTFEVLPDDTSLPELSKDLRKLEDYLVFTLQSLPTVQGVIQDSNGAPVKNAQVQVTNHYGNLLFSRSSIVTTQDDGTFTLTRIPANDRRLMGSEWPRMPRTILLLDLYVKHPDFAPFYDQGLQVNNDKLEPIRLDAGATVDLTILRDGVPVHEEITLQPYGLINRNPKSPNYKTGRTIDKDDPPIFLDQLEKHGKTENGRVIFEGVMPATYVVPIPMPNPKPLNVFYHHLLVVGDLTQTVTLPEVVEIQGRVIDDQTNLENVVLLFERDGVISEFSYTKTQTTAEGYKTSLFSGNYKVSLQVKNMSVEPQMVNIPWNNKTQHLDLPIDLPQKYLVKLVDAETGQVIPESQVYISYNHRGEDNNIGVGYAMKPDGDRYVLRLAKDTTLKDLSFTSTGYEKTFLPEKDLNALLLGNSLTVKMKKK